MEESKPSLVVGNLYLIPTTLGDTAPLEVLPYSLKGTVENINHFIAENEKTARRFIKKLLPNKAQGELVFQRLNKFTEPQEIPSFLDPCIQGFHIGLLSEAGCPGIADPGADVVRLAHEKKIRVVPLVGPSSILLAMIETPYRNDKLLTELTKTLHPQTRLCIAVDLSLQTEFITTKTINEWKKITLDLHKRPAIFIIQA